MLIIRRSVTTLPRIVSSGWAAVVDWRCHDHRGTLVTVYCWTALFDLLLFLWWALSLLDTSTLFNACGQEAEQEVRGFPALVIDLVAIEYLWAGLVLFHELNNRLLKSEILSVHDMIERNALLRRIVIVVLTDVSVTATYSDHAFFASDHHLFDLCAN